VVEELLQLLIRVVDAELFKGIQLQTNQKANQITAVPEVLQYMKPKLPRM
jgi:hypothetical protein